MKKIIHLLFFCIFLSGCSTFRVHRMNVEQGNLIYIESVERLKIGMSEEKVKSIMGTPLVSHLFTPNHMIYVYTFKSGHDPIHIKKVICRFNHQKLEKITFENDF